MTDAAPIPPATIDTALAQARALIAALGEEGRHHVAAAVLTGDGGIHLGVSLESAVATASICAEPGAVSRALIDAPGEDIAVCLAVNRDGAIVPPCSRCRELLADFAPSVHVALPGASGYRLVPLRVLMPYPYKAGLRFGEQTS